PSDSIAIALRMGASIYTSGELLDNNTIEIAEASEVADPGTQAQDEDEDVGGLRAEELKEYLRRLNPEDFGRFTPCASLCIPSGRPCSLLRAGCSCAGRCTPSPASCAAGSSTREGARSRTRSSPSTASSAPTAARSAAPRRTKMGASSSNSNPDPGAASTSRRPGS